jgi:NAD-dependent SIR2 family protein deacetylase
MVKMTYKRPAKVFYAVVEAWKSKCLGCEQTIRRDSVCQVEETDMARMVVKCPSCKDWKLS